MNSIFTRTKLRNIHCNDDILPDANVTKAESVNSQEYLILANTYYPYKAIFLFAVQNKVNSPCIQFIRT